MRALKFVAIVFFVSGLRAQNQQVLRFTNRPTTIGMQEIATTLRTVTDIRKLSLDAQAATISVNGTAGQIAMAEWLVHELDRTAPGQTASLPVPGAVDEMLSVFYVRNASVPMGLQEMITTLRTVCNTQLIYTYSSLGAMVLRGTAAETARDAWLIQQMDKPVQSRVSEPSDYRLPGAIDDLIRVVHLPQGTMQPNFGQLVTAIRTTGQIKHVYGGTAQLALAMRGTTAEIALSQRLIDGWQKP